MSIEPLPGQEALLAFRGKLPDDATPDEIAALAHAVAVVLDAATAAARRVDREDAVLAPTVVRLEYGSDFLVVVATITAVATAVKLITGAVKDIVDIANTRRPSTAAAELQGEQIRLTRLQADELERQREERLRSSVDEALARADATTDEALDTVSHRDVASIEERDAVEIARQALSSDEVVAQNEPAVAASIIATYGIDVGLDVPGESDVDA